MGKYCPKCGTELKDDVVFCYRCGNKVPVVKTEKPVEAHSETADEKKLARMQAKEASLKDEAELQAKELKRASAKPKTKQGKKPMRIVISICAAVLVLAIAAAAVFVVIPMLGGKKGNVSFKPLTTYAADSAEDLKTQIVKVTNTTGDGKIIGTGFFTPDGCLVTGSNIVDTQGAIIVTYADGTEDNATLVSNDIYTNTAVLKVDEPSVQALKINADASANDGSVNYYVVGYQEAKTEPEVIPVNVSTSTTSKGEAYSIEDSLDCGLIGSPVVDEAGNLVGVVAQANSRVDIAMMGTISEIGTNTKALKDEQIINPADSSTRVNQYTEAATEIYDISEDELYIEGIYIYGSYTTETNVKLDIHQKNNGLVKLYFEAMGEFGMSFHSMGQASTATIITDQGKYSCQLNDTKVESGDKGVIIMKFENYAGTAKELWIEPVLATPYSDASSTIIIPLETYQHASSDISSADDISKAEVNAAFLGFLEGMKGYEDNPDENYVSIDYGNEQMPPMIFYRTVDDSYTGDTAIHMALYDQGKLIEISGEYPFENTLDDSRHLFSVVHSNGAAMDAIHTELLKLAGDSSLYVYYRDYLNQDTCNHLDQYIYKNGKLSLQKSIKGEETPFGPPNQPSYEQDQINALLKNTEKCYVSLIDYTYEDMEIEAALDPSTYSDELTFLSYDEAIDVLSK